MYLKLILRIVEVYSNVLVLISQVPRSTEVTPYTQTYGTPVKNAENRHFFHEKWSESTSSISDVPETYIENSWGL